MNLEDVLKISFTIKRKKWSEYIQISRSSINQWPRLIYNNKKMRHLTVEELRAIDWEPKGE